MKKVITMLLLIATMKGFSQKDECAKHFKKEKKSKKESMFAGDKLIKTDYVKIWHDHKRLVLISFKYTDKPYLCFQQETFDNLFNQPIEFTTSMKFGFLFEGGETYTVTFSHNETKTDLTKDWHISQNEIPIDEKLNELLKSKTLTRIEILNPYNYRNESKTIADDVSKKSAGKVIEFYNCFTLKTANTTAAK